MRYRVTSQMAGLAIAVLMIGGCSSTSGHSRAERTQDRFQDTRDLLAQVRTQVDATIDAANNMVDPGTTDPVAAYNRFAKSVEELQKRSKRLDEGIREAEDTSRDYFTAWEKEGATISDPDLRRASVERRTRHYGATQQLFVTINSVSNDLDELLKIVQDTKHFANYNKTPESIATLQPIIDRAVRQADIVKGDLDAAMLHIDEANESAMN